jgi:hypothetical protein
MKGSKMTMPGPIKFGSTLELSRKTGKVYEKWTMRRYAS